jgi:hypothetical protein
MTKTKVFQKDFRMTEASPYTVRCGIAVEKVVPLTQVSSQLTRRKKRRRYVHRAAWAFDLTEVVSNTDIDTEESFEVEIELLDTGVMFERTMDAIAARGLRLVRDAMDMLAK